MQICIITLLVFVNGKPVVMDLLSLERAYRAHHINLVRSFAFDAILATVSRTETISVDRARGFLGEASHCQYTGYPSRGQGADYRFQGANVAGLPLLVDNEVIHTALFGPN